jgi:3-hydroxymyristoyl/3-hydroxydecanoyl-(acyl carrier protein) dehydratase
MMRFAVDHAHKSLPGHFPGRPVVPGVVLLDHVLAAIACAHPDMPAVAGLESAKFLAPVLPGEEIEVACRRLASGRLEFSATRAGRPVLRGRAVLAGEA